MAITFIIDNDPQTIGLQDLTLDESAGLTDNDVAVAYDPGTNQLTSGTLNGAFLDYLEGLFADDTAKDTALSYVSAVGGASSSATFITVSVDEGETVDNLFFSVAGNGYISTTTTLAGEDLYFHVGANADFATLTTLGGRIVAAFYLNEAADHLSAQVQMVTFEPLLHGDETDPDDHFNFSDVLQVSAVGSLSFDFDNLDSGNFLWVAIGTETAGILLTGDDLNVNSDAGSNKFGSLINGGSDSSDTMNTSQGGEGATIGVNSQHFVAGGTQQNPADGSIANVTLVTGFVPLPTAAQADGTNEQATGTTIQPVDYDGYINTTGAGVFISQLTGTNADVRISLFEAGGGTNPEEGFSYLENDGINGGETNVGDDTALSDDTEIAVGTVTITRGGVDYEFTATSTNAAIGVTVTFGSGATANEVTVTGAIALDTISWTAATGETFNRFSIQALSTTDAFDIGRIDILQGVEESAGLGSHLFVDDDGPAVTLTGDEATLTVDETTLGTDDPEGFAPAFDAEFGTDGEADTGPLTYALSTPGGDSGLVDTLSGNAVFLFEESGDVVGREGTDAADAATGDIVFTVSVDTDTGEVTLDQVRAVVHDEADHDEAADPARLSADDLIQLTATATDGDGDQASATLDIGLNLNFEDDGPDINLTGATVPTLTNDDTEITDTAGPTSFAGLFTGPFGNDGFKDSDDNDIEDLDAIRYALGVSASGGVYSGVDDTLSGDKIYLYLESGAVVGRVGNDDGTANSGGAIAFTISVNGNSGAVTFVQSRSVVHNDSGDPSESTSPAGLASAGLVTLTATIEDGDGDTDSATADIGDAFKFDDDGPSIDPNGAPPELIVDESAFGTDHTLSFADAFTSGFGQDGPKDSDDDNLEDADALAYALGFNNDVPTGLTDTLSGEAVELSEEGGDIVGRTETGGDEVFRVSVNADTGAVTLDQSRAVVHTVTTDPNDSRTLATDNLITLTATVTDGDGDHDSETIGIARSLNFLDDGPDISRNDQVLPHLFTDDSLTPGDSDGPVDFSFLFNEDFGNDGFKDSDDNDVEDGDAVAYALSVNGPDGTDSGLVDTLTGDPILLRLVGGDVEGYVADGDLLVFRIELDELTGAITQTQYRAIFHDDPADSEESGDSSEAMAADLIVLTATITDGDGDTDDAATDIGDAFRFLDDGPSVIGENVKVFVDDDGGAGGNPDGTGDSGALRVTNGTVEPVFDGGADGLKSYTLTLANLDPQPTLTSQGGEVEFDQTSNLLTAYVDTDLSGDYDALEDREVFTFALNSTTGDFTFTLIDQIDHDPTDSTEDNLDIDIGLVLQAIDGDDDQSGSALNLQLNIDFDDDSPVIVSQISDGIVDGNVVGNSVTNSLNGAVGFDDNDANDETAAGVKTYTFVDNFSTPVNAWPDLVGELSVDGTTIEYRDGAGGDLVYSIVLAQDGSGEYTFTVHKETTARELNFDFTDLPSGQNLFGVLVDRENGVQDIDGKGLLVVGRDAVLNPATGAYTNASDTINTSKGGGGVTIGVDNQMFDPGDGAVFVFLDNPDDKAIGGLNPGGLTQNTADDADTLGFVATYNTRGAELEVVQKQGSAVCGMKITAYNVDVPGADDEIDSANSPLGADVNAEGRSFIDNPLGSPGTTTVSINSVQVFDRANPNVLLLDATISDTGVVTILTQAAGYNVTASQTLGAWSITVTGFNANDSIRYTTAADHDAVLTEGTSGKWDLGGVNLTENVDLPDQLFDFTVAINDYDGDSGGGVGTTFANFQIGVDGTGDADDDSVAGVDPLPVPIAPLAAMAEINAFHQAAGDWSASDFTMDLSRMAHIA